MLLTGWMVLAQLEQNKNIWMWMSMLRGMVTRVFFKKRKKQHQIHQKGISPECPCEFNSSPVQLVKPDVPNHRIQQGCARTGDKDTHSHWKQQTNCATVFRKSCNLTGGALSFWLKCPHGIPVIKFWPHHIYSKKTWEFGKSFSVWETRPYKCYATNVWGVGT